MDTSVTFGERDFKQPGQIWITVAIIAGVIGGGTVITAVLGGRIMEAIGALAATFLACLLCGTLANIINRLDGIEQQLERLGRELKKTD